MSAWRPWTAFAVGWWLGRLVGFVVVSVRLTRRLRRLAANLEGVAIPVEEEAPRG